MLRSGDTLVVWRLDRLARSLKHLIELITDLEERDIGFKSLTESIDTTTSGGKLVFHIFGALAEFERGVITDRTRAGLAAARARGRHGGRPTTLSDKQQALAVKLYKEGKATSSSIARFNLMRYATLPLRWRNKLAACATVKNSYTREWQSTRGPRQRGRPRQIVFA